MRKTYPLRPEGKHPDRVLDAVKHDIRKYQKRERRRELPPGADFWDFDCRFGLSEETAEVIHVGAFMDRINEAAAAQAPAFYLELLAKPAQRSFVPRASALDDGDEE